ncbi:hypothetical protein EJB05_02342 [Eragrostis curvula]|uniref:Uncharacterized protein n=1 Tax=Eragrostis curvula TaxID=38414 RepID=A0A5J9WUS0_9POAL|nr:hypothetical protein EJB05_55519 [Eragrostis curvula]TVU50944.1 hypothetical protein EJB05_02342 [Eragrostis curvula]
MDRIEPTISRLAAISCVTSTGNQPWVMANYLMCNNDRSHDRETNTYGINAFVANPKSEAISLPPPPQIERSSPCCSC